MLTDRGTEFCGTQSHEYELYLAVEDIDHSRTKTKSPQTTDVIDKQFLCSAAHSGDCDRPIRPKVITDSGDRDHAVMRPERPA